MIFRHTLVNILVIIDKVNSNQYVTIYSLKVVLFSPHKLVICQTQVGIIVQTDDFSSRDIYSYIPVGQHGQVSEEILLMAKNSMFDSIGKI